MRLGSRLAAGASAKLTDRRGATAIRASVSVLQSDSDFEVLAGTATPPRRRALRGLALVLARFKPESVGQDIRPSRCNWGGVLVVTPLIHSCLASRARR